MSRPFDPEAVARFVAETHVRRADYVNVPDEFGLASVDAAYQAQHAFAQLMASQEGGVAGAKIATTTKVSNS